MFQSVVSTHQSYDWKNPTKQKNNLLLQQSAYFWLAPSFLFPWRASASPLFFFPSIAPSAHPSLWLFKRVPGKHCDPSNLGCARGAESREREGPCDSPHSLLTEPVEMAGEGEKLLPWLPAGSFCPCVWRALAVPSLTNAWVGGGGGGFVGGGGERVRGEVGGVQLLKRRWGAGKGDSTMSLHWLGKEQQKSSTEDSGGWSASYTHTHPHTWTHTQKLMTGLTAVGGLKRSGSG